MKEQLEAGRFVVSVEVDPPRGLDLSETLAAVRRLIAAGASCINVGDTPMAEARMSPLSTAALYHQSAGADVIAHVVTRDRNARAIEADLIGAHVLGVRNILCIGGDARILDAYSRATAVHDLRPLDLMRLLRGYNEGHNSFGQPIDPPARFSIGAGIDASAADLEAEVRLAKRKAEAGAQFFISQPLFDVAAAERLLDALGPRRLPIVWGVWPLRSARQARFVHERIVPVPASVQDAMERAGAGVVEAGLELAQALLEQLLPLADGVYFIPSFGRYEGVEQLVRQARRLRL